MNELNIPAGWKNVEGQVHKEFNFANFVEAFGFVTKIALESEKMNHHPDITISYNRVVINLMTHDTNSISNKDIDLAMKIDKLNPSIEK
jgi:4a-hydroxytetrahydrobiopterin dehydratase